MAFLVGIVGALVALMVWVELLIRGALVYVLLGFLPLVSAVVIWPAAGGAMRKLLRLLLVTILSKLVIAGVLALGLASLTAAGEGGVGAGVEQVLAGVAMLALAAISPLTAYRLLPFFEEHAQQRGGISAGKGARVASTLAAQPMLGGAGRAAGMAWCDARVEASARCRSWAAPDERRPTRSSAAGFAPPESGGFVAGLRPLQLVVGGVGAGLAVLVASLVPTVARAAGAASRLGGARVRARAHRGRARCSTAPSRRSAS